MASEDSSGPEPEKDTEGVEGCFPSKPAKVKRRCQFEGCGRLTNNSGKYGMWCHVHSGGKPDLCIVKGCKTLKQARYAPFCAIHKNHEYDETHEAQDMVPEYEIVRRIKRNRRLREKMIMQVAFEQDSKCASSLKTCLKVKNGKATDRCPFKGEEVPYDMQELDHKVRVADGGSDERSNLQMLCACCHAMKTRREMRKEFGFEI